MTTSWMFLAFLGGAFVLERPHLDPDAARQAELAAVNENLARVDRALADNDRLLAKTRESRFVPELELRRCELFVEKSRYLVHRQRLSRPGGSDSGTSPEAKLLKQKVIQMYDRLLREHPDFVGADKATFFLAHEQRELGQSEDMLRTLGELSRKFPKSPLVAEAEQILGDHFFDASNLDEAEKHYQAVLKRPLSPSHDFARYKLGWIRINQAKHPEAVTYLEAAVTSSLAPGADPLRARGVKQQALLDMVLSYLEANPKKDAFAYFFRLSESRATYALALEKLATRYGIRQEQDRAAEAWRRLLELSPDSKEDVERVQRLYDALLTEGVKAQPTPRDVAFVVRAAAGLKADTEAPLADRKKALAGLETMARDLATRLHVRAQKEDKKALFADASEAYDTYLSLFRGAGRVAVMMKNRADATLAAGQGWRAGRQYEELAEFFDARRAKGHQEALYGSLVAYQAALRDDAGGRDQLLLRVDSRQALQHLGKAFASRYPKHPEVAQVRFAVARAYYDDGEAKEASALLETFARTYPSHKDAAVAAHLALDAHRRARSFDGLQQAGKRLLASGLPAGVKQELRRVLDQSREGQLSELALASVEKGGDVVESLLAVADGNAGKDLGERALLAAIQAAREKRDLATQENLSRRFLAEHQRSAKLADVLAALGRSLSEAARFADAAAWFEQAARTSKGSAAQDSALASARLYAALGQHEKVVAVAQSAASLGQGPRRAEAIHLLAEAALLRGDKASATEAARKALSENPADVVAMSVLARAGSASEPGLLAGLLQSAGGEGEEAARGAWHAAEPLFFEFERLGVGELERKVELLGQLEAVYSRVVGLGSAEWAVAAMWRTALTYQRLGATLAAEPSLQERAAGLTARAKETFAVCAEKATQLGVFTSPALGCHLQKGEVNAPAVTAQRGSPNLAELERRAFAQQDAASFEQLGLGYLGAGRVFEARLTLSRAVEREPGRASAHNALGLALLVQGEASAAGASYAKALSLAPSLPSARANLAALRCRYGDAAGARRELEQLAGQEELSGVEIDPEWRSCHAALSHR